MRMILKWKSSTFIVLEEELKLYEIEWDEDSNLEVTNVFVYLTDAPETASVAGVSPLYSWYLGVGQWCWKEWLQCEWGVFNYALEAVPRGERRRATGRK